FSVSMRRMQGRGYGLDLEGMVVCVCVRVRVRVCVLFWFLCSSVSTGPTHLPRPCLTQVPGWTSSGIGGGGGDGDGRVFRRASTRSLAASSCASCSSRWGKSAELQR